MPIQDIPLNQLVLSDLNVRKTRAKQDIESMAQSIGAHGVLQNLLAHPTKDGKFGVVIGGTRLEAMNLLLQKGMIGGDYVVPVEVCPADDATLTERSLSENFRRSAMHPADEFDAFKKLADQGHGNETIASRFGTTPRVVEQRLKLAVVSPKLVAAYRKGEMELEHLMALTVTDNHRQQEKTWRELPDWAKHGRATDGARTIRDQLTEKHIDASQNALAKFVGVEAYRDAGGGIVRDLFADEADPGYFTDAKLLTKLADERLKALAEPVKAEGWKWLEIRPEWGWQDEQKMSRISASPSPEQRAEIADLEMQQNKIVEEEADEHGDLPPKADAKYAELEKQIDAIRAETAFTLAQKALGGVVVTIGRDGKAEIRRGLVKAEDAKAAKKLDAKPKTKTNGKAEEDGEKGEPTFSAALIENLTAHRTAAMQAKLATNPKVALVAVTHALALNLLERSGYSVVQITGREPNLTAAGEELGKSPAAKEFAAATREATKGMPKDGAKLWGWLMQQDQRRIMAILAVAAAHTVDAVQRKFNGADRAHADQLATALKLDMSAYWSAGADNFFSRVSRKQTLAAVTGAAGEKVAEGMPAKKAELVTAAEKATKGKGWLPAPLQNG